MKTDQENNYTRQIESIANSTRTNKILRFFPNSDLRCSHDGLSKVAKKNGIDANMLGPGEFLVFCNHRQNRFKIYAPGNILVYLKSPDDRPLEMRVVQLIPRFFNGTEFNYNAALKRFLISKINRLKK